MKSTNDFIHEWEWKKYQESVWFWYQCVALDKLYYERVIWVMIGSFGWSAINWWRKFPFWNLFRKINNTLFARPQVWDILFWDRWEYWHTAICIRSTLWNVQYIEQNGGKGTWTWMWSDAIRVATSSYKGILGWASFTPLDK